MSNEEATPTQETPAADKPSAAPTPIFGQATTFGQGTGFGGFAGAAGGFAGAAEGSTGGLSFGPSSANGAGTTGEGKEEEEVANEEECDAHFTPVVQLQEVETVSGEEEEAALLDYKCKLYRFDQSNNEWKERGVGQVKLLQHKENKKIRLLMRQEKTLKVRANHIVMPGTTMKDHMGSDKALVWSACDYADEEMKTELFCIRFGNAERTQDFKEKVEAAAATNGELLGQVPVTETKEKAAGDAADALADQLEKKAEVSEEKTEVAQGLNGV